ncbi:unnamed protein product [Calypogeia fissa]
MMAGWLARRRICKRGSVPQAYIEICLLFIVTSWMNLATKSYGQQQPQGFVNIDCGGLGGVDSTTTLEYISDINSSFILTGNSSIDISSTENTIPYRFFPQPRSKYCYEVPTMRNTTYLVRAVFDLEFSLVLPIKFVVFINATNVFTMTYSTNQSANVSSDILEGIFYSPGSIMYVCLQPLIGTPFISSLELRPLDPAMYSYSFSDRQYLANLIRWNIGADPTSSPSMIR